MTRTSNRILPCVVLAAMSLFLAVADNLPPSACGTFVQKRILADVDVTLVSRGKFRFERGRFFEWNTLEPVSSVFYATPTNYAFTAGGGTTVRRLDVDVTSMARLFEVKEMKEFVKSVKTTPETGFPRRVQVEFKNGDRLEIDLDAGGHAAGRTSARP